MTRKMYTLELDQNEYDFVISIALLESDEPDLAKWKKTALKQVLKMRPMDEEAAYRKEIKRRLKEK